MFWRFCRTKPFIDSYSTSRDRQSNASPLFFGSPLMKHNLTHLRLKPPYFFGTVPTQSELFNKINA